MKVTSINFLNVVNKVQNKKVVNFCALAPLKKDSFEKSTEKTVVIKDINGNDVPAIIKEEYDYNNIWSDYKNPKKISLNVNGKRLGYATMYDYKGNDALFIEHIHTEENYDRHYKGAGTELLKSLVEESKKRGFKGEIILIASHCPPPFVFYYKNNFIPYEENDIGPLYNPAIDYATRNNIKVGKVIDKNIRAVRMHLDEKGADNLLRGVRLYETRKFETIAKKIIDGQSYEANYIESDEKDKFYLQIINNDAEEYKQRWVSKGEILEDERGEKYARLLSINDSYTPENCEDFVIETIQKLKDYLNVQRVEIDEK